jgi:hypothetical protein
MSTRRLSIGRRPPGCTPTDNRKYPVPLRLIGKLTIRLESTFFDKVPPARHEFQYWRSMVPGDPGEGGE